MKKIALDNYFYGEQTISIEHGKIEPVIAMIRTEITKIKDKIQIIEGEKTKIEN
jgi:hypothetical protein